MLQSLSYAGPLESSRRPCPQTAGDPVLIRLLGDFRVQRGEEVQPLPPESKLAVLLRRLALAGASGVPRQDLLGLLWPDLDDVKTAHCLNTLVTDLRGLLRDEARGVQAVVHMGGYYRLERSTCLAVDVDCFDRCYEAGRAAEAAGEAFVARQAYEQALALYRGDLSMGRDGADDNWLFVERERLRSRCMTLLARVADLSGGMNDLEVALGQATRLLRMDPCSEVGHRLLMQLHMLGGQRAQALHQYRVCAEALHREYEAIPESASRSLFDLLRSGAWTESAGWGLIGS